MADRAAVRRRRLGHEPVPDRAVSALVHPALLAVVMIVVLVMMFTLVLPRLEPLFAQSADRPPLPAAVQLAVRSQQLW